MINCVRVNLIVFGMCSNKFDKNPLPNITYLNNQPVLVSRNVEYHSVIFYRISIRKISDNI